MNFNNIPDFLPIIIMVLAFLTAGNQLFEYKTSTDEEKKIRVVALSWQLNCFLWCLMFIFKGAN